jgi:hypothetical protein
MLYAVVDKFPGAPLPKPAGAPISKPAEAPMTTTVSRPEPLADRPLSWPDSGFRNIGRGTKGG